MIVPTEINRNLVTDETDSDNVPIFAANDAGDACPGKEGFLFLEAWKNVGLSMDDQSSSCGIPAAVFESSQCHLTHRWLSSSLLCVLGGICSWLLRVRMWFIPWSLAVFFLSALSSFEKVHLFQLPVWI